MKNLLLLITVVFTGLISQAQTLVAPVMADVSASINRTTFNVYITDSNPSEVAIEVEYEGAGVKTSVFLSPGSTFNQTLTNLKPKTLYSVRARALGCPTPISCGDISPWSNTIYSTTLIDFPAAVILRSNYNCPTVVGLDWDVPTRPEDNESFIVQRSFDNSSFNTIANLTPGFRTYYDNDAKPGRTIYYKIISQNSAGLKESNRIPVSVKAYTGPKDPVNVRSDQAGKTTTSLTIRWDNPAEDLACGSDIRSSIYLMIKRPNETQYTIYKELSKNATSSVIDGLKIKETIDFRVFAMSNQGLQSTWVGGRDITLGPPNPPTNLIGIAFKDNLNSSSMRLEWKDESADEDYFTLEYSLDSINFTTLGKVKFDITTFKHGNVEEGIKYFYRLKAGSYLGESPYTPISFGITYPYSAKPNAPYGLAATLVASKVNLKWYDDSNKEESYVLERSVDNITTFAELKKLARNTTTYTDGDVTVGKTYYYRVKAINPIGESAYSNIKDIKIAAAPAGSIDNQVNIFPNPTFEFITVDLSNELQSGIVNISIYDDSNRLILSKDYNSTKFKVNLNNFKSGMYNIVLKSDEFSTSKKVYKY